MKSICRKLTALLLVILLAVSSLPLTASASAIKSEYNTVEKLISNNSIGDLLDYLVTNINSQADILIAPVLRIVFLAKNNDDINAIIGTREVTQLSGQEASKVLVTWLDTNILPDLAYDLENNNAIRIINENIPGLQVKLGSVQDVFDTLAQFDNTGIKTLLNILGDAQDLDVSAVKGVKVAGNEMGAVKAMIRFVKDNMGIIKKLLNGSLDLGVLNSFLGDNLAKFTQLPQLIKSHIYKLIDSDAAAGEFKDDAMGGDWATSAYNDYSADQLIAVSLVKRLTKNSDELISKNEANKVLGLSFYGILTKYAPVLYKNFANDYLSESIQNLFDHIPADVRGYFASAVPVFSETSFSEFFTNAADGGFWDQFNNVLVKTAKLMLSPSAFSMLGLVQGDNTNLNDNLTKFCRFLLPILFRIEDKIGYTFPESIKAEDVNTLSLADMAIYILKPVFTAWFNGNPKFSKTAVNSADSLEDMAVLAAYYFATDADRVNVNYDFSAIESKIFKGGVLNDFNNNTATDIFLETCAGIIIGTLNYNAEKQSLSIDIEGSDWETLFNGLANWALDFLYGMPAAARVHDLRNTNGYGPFYKLNVLLNELIDFTFLNNVSGATFKFDLETLFRSGVLENLYEGDLAGMIGIVEKNTKAGNVLNGQIVPSAIGIVNRILTALFEHSCGSHANRTETMDDPMNPCTKQIKKEYEYCTVCGAYFKYKETSITKSTATHKFSAWETVVTVIDDSLITLTTCNYKTQQQRICSICGSIDKQSEKIASHKWDSPNAADPRCTVCGKSVSELKGEKQYTVSFDANGGTGAPDPQIKTEGAALTLSTVKPVKTYTISFNANGGSVSQTSKTVSSTFRVWNTEQNGGGMIYHPGGSYTADADVTLYAQWDDPWANSLPTPERSGYIFWGWYTAASGGATIDSDSKITSDVTLYAHWVKGSPEFSVEQVGTEDGDIVKIALYADRCINLVTADITVNYDADDLTIIKKKELRYSVEGADAVQLYDVSSNSLTWADNGEQAGQISCSFFFGSALWNAEKFAAKARTGKTVSINDTHFQLAVFYFRVNVGAKNKTPFSITVDHITGTQASGGNYTVTLPVPETDSYTATFLINGGTWSNGTNESSRTRSYKDDEVLVAVFSQSGGINWPFSRTGYLFAGWKVKSCSNGNWKVGNVYKDNWLAAKKGYYGDVTFEAQWTPAYTATFLINGGMWANGTNEASRKLTYGAFNTLVGVFPENKGTNWPFTRAGYEFAGWKVKSCSGGNWSVGTVYADNWLAHKTGMTGNVTFEAQWKEAQPQPTDPSFTWGKDNWNFYNSSITGDFSSGTYRSQINTAYQNKLKANLTNSEYQDIFGKGGWLDDKWGGSCYGMSSTTLLAKQGYLPYAKYKSGASSLYELSRPTADADISSLITYYQMLQVKDVIQQQYRTVPNRSNETNIKLILSLLDNNPTVLIGFQKANWGGHAILAYGYEYGSYSKNGVTYQGCIKICDPNASKAYNPDCNIYFNTQSFEWAIPYYWSYGIMSSRGARFNYIGANVNEINRGGYLTGTVNTLTEGFVARIDAYAISESRAVNKVQKTGNNYNKLNAAPGDILEDYSYVLGNESEGTLGYNLMDADAAYMVTQDNPETIDLKMDYDHCDLKASSVAGKKVIFDRSGYVEVTGEAADYSLEMVFDCDYPTDWYAVQVEGTGADFASLGKTEEGYVISANTLENVTVYANNRDNTAEVTFSTTYSSVLIYEINETAIGIKADTDNDGFYETEVETREGPQDPMNTKLGDVDGDNNITASDARLALRRAVGLETYTPGSNEFIACDVDKDGAITASDARLILRAAVGLEDPKQW